VKAFLSNNERNTGPFVPDFQSGFIVNARNAIIEQRTQVGLVRRTSVPAKGKALDSSVHLADCLILACTGNIKDF
jgi:hypothetical protein